MEQDAYRAQIAEAYRGERLAGRALALVDMGPDPRTSHADDVALLHRLELHMAEAMLPLMERHGIPLPDEATIAEEAAALAPQLGDWPQMMTTLRAMMPAVVETYDRLAANALPADHALLEYFAEHERALLRIGEADLQDEAAQAAAIGAVATLIATPPDGPPTSAPVG